MAGGVPEVMLHLRRLGLLELSCRTAAGDTLERTLDWWEGSERRRALRERLRAQDPRRCKACFPPPPRSRRQPSGRIPRVAGRTDDPMLQTYKFTNVYHASDRTSQYLIRHVLYEGPQSAEEIVFRTLLFKFFNRISTWEALTAQVGPPRWRTFEAERYARVLDTLKRPIYSGAYDSGQPMGDSPSPNIGDISN
jgi:hypothetical protein